MIGRWITGEAYLLEDGEVSVEAAGVAQEVHVVGDEAVEEEERLGLLHALEGLEEHLTGLGRQEIRWDADGEVGNQIRDQS
jgi:hypothetical protein